VDRPIASGAQRYQPLVLLHASKASIAHRASDAAARASSNVAKREPATVSVMVEVALTGISRPTSPRTVSSHVPCATSFTQMR